MEYIRNVVPEAVIKGRDKYLHPTDNGQVRLGNSVRNYFSVRTILNSTGYCQLPL